MIQLQAGDMFAVNSGSPIAKAINGVSGFWSADGKSKYNHAGLIINHLGDTFEALRKLDCYNINAYKGRPILIARPKVEGDAPKKIAEVLQSLMLRHRGQKYPWWRIGLHLIPPLARKVSYKGLWLVCSELVAKAAWMLKVRHENYTGTTPDKLAEEWVHWKEYDIIFEGVWE